MLEAIASKRSMAYSETGKQTIPPKVANLDVELYSDDVRRGNLLSRPDSLEMTRQSPDQPSDWRGRSTADANRSSISSESSGNIEEVIEPEATIIGFGIS